MEVVLAIVIGGLYAAGFYMLLRRSMIKVIIGLVLLGHAANLLIFTVGGLNRGDPALLPAEGAAAVATDPVPQALILTAIVIGFGIQAFALVLFKRVYQAVGSVDLDKIRTTDT
jgi:multicomponent Na+:H+ antiporter subunit C